MLKKRIAVLLAVVGVAAAAAGAGGAGRSSAKAALADYTLAPLGVADGSE